MTVKTIPLTKGNMDINTDFFHYLKQLGMKDTNGTSKNGTDVKVYPHFNRLSGIFFYIYAIRIVAFPAIPFYK